MEEEVVKDPREKVGQEQIHDLLFDDRLSWQTIIYDLINSEQLDPWDINLSVLANKYIEKVRTLEEANFFISSKVLLAASLLLRLKSEILLSRDLQSIDDILYGKKEEKKDSLQELILALSKAISTENRREHKALILKQHEINAYLPIPKKLFNLQDKIKGLYSKIKQMFVGRDERIAMSELSSMDSEEKLLTFVSLLYLDTQQKVWLEQDGHFEEIWVLLKEMYEAKNKDLIERLKKEMEMLEEEQEAESVVEKVSGFSEVGKE